MATGSRRSSKGTSRRTTARKSTSKNSRNKKNNTTPGIIEEVILVIVFGISILLFLGTLGLLGSFGQIVRGLLVGLFGMAGFVFPFAFFFAVTFFISNKWEKITKVRLITTFVFLCDLSCFAQLIFARDVYINGLTDYYTSEVKNGGFLGGIFTHFLCKFLGMAGTIVILVVVLVICLVLLTDRSLIKSVKEGSKLFSDDFKRNREYRREIQEIRNSEREVAEMRRWEKRNERHESRARRQEERRAQELEARRKRAEEAKQRAEEDRLANIGRMKFDRTDLKNQGFDSEADNISDEYDVNDSEIVQSNDQVVEKEPESMFYGRASEQVAYGTAFMPDTTDILKYTSDALAISEAANVGLLNATKLSRESVNGDMQEITSNYIPDDEFVDFVNRNHLNTSHRINVDIEAEKEMQDAYERDIVVNEPASFDDYDDVARLFSERRNKIARNHSINIDPSNNNDNITAEINDDYIEDNYTQENYDNNYEDDYGDSSNEINSGSYKDDIDSDDDSNNQNKVVSINPRLSGTDLSVENAKPAPVSNVVSQGKSIKPKKSGKYKLPPVTLLDEARGGENQLKAKQELEATAFELKDALREFGLEVEIIGSSRGPAVTRYELEMPKGVSVKKITNLADDIMMSLGAKDIRIEAPIPGKKAVGIELPNRESTMVHFRELIDSKEFKNFDSKVAFGVGKDLSGDIVVSDIAKMPHLLIAGATGSGKSVCINTLIMSILFKAKPEEVKLIMIDPKMVELSVYNGIPHLLIPVVTDPKKASAALDWAVAEMTTRYEKFKEVGVRDMKGYNAKITTSPEYINDDNHEYMPQIVIVVDELADLMMVASKEVEASICRLAQLARAAGIYLILATQRPSVDVITGLIKANMPSRIAFSVSSGVDSRTILDMFGAEKLLGNGDMLFFPRGYNKPSRVQGAFVSDAEVERVVDFVSGQIDGDYYNEAALNAVNAGGMSSAGGSAGLVDPQNAFDDLFTVAGHAVIESDKASIGMLQRKFKIGFNRAARIMDQLSENNVVGPEEGTKPRRILMTMEQFNQMIEEMNHQ